MRASAPGQSVLLLLDAVAVLGNEEVDYAVIGAIAASVHAVVRASVNADAVLSVSRQQHPGRLASMEATESCAARATELRHERATIERYFGTLSGSGGGLNALPAWVRRLRRVRVWVGAKIVINAARHVSRRSLAA